MIIQTALASALLLTLQAAPAESGEVTRAAAQSDEKTEEQAESLDEDDKMVCRRVSRIGTRFKKRVCATQGEWDALAERSRTDTEDLQRRGFVPGQAPGGWYLSIGSKIRRTSKMAALLFGRPPFCLNNRAQGVSMDTVLFAIYVLSASRRRCPQWSSKSQYR